MSIDQYVGQIPHIAEIVSRAGFVGIEPEICMLGAYWQHPEQLQEQLAQRGLALGALCLALAWQHQEETAEEAAEADRAIEYVSRFPGALLIFAQLPGHDRKELATRQANLLANLHAIAARAQSRGVRCAFHPNSPEGSIFRTEEDYGRLFERLDSSLCGYVPDTGHIAKGGMDPLAVIQRHYDRIAHIHFKDMDASGQWASMGQGAIDHEAIVAWLKEQGYRGWIMVEEESLQAVSDPDGVTLHNGRYVRQRLATL